MVKQQSVKEKEVNEFLKSEQSMDIIIHKFTDEKKLKILPFIHNNDEVKYQIINSMKHVKNKISGIQFLQNDELCESIVDRFQSDKEKAEALLYIYKDEVKGRIIIYLKSDKYKIASLEHIVSDEIKMKIIVSMKSDKNKIKVIDCIKEEYYQRKALETISINDTLILESLEKVESPRIIAKLVRQVKSKETKIKVLDLINDDLLKIEILRTFRYEDRIRYIEKIGSLEDQEDILSQIKDDNVKIKMLPNIKNEETKSLLISSLENDEIKLKLLKNIKKESNKVKIIASFKNDNYKVEEMDKIKSKQKKAIVLSSVKDKKTIKDHIQISKKDISIDLPPDMTFGIEIESEGKESDSILKMDYMMKNWKVKNDASLTDGVEVVSPILKNNESDIDDIYVICKLLKKMGQYTNVDCGGHIHIGADYLKDINSYANLIEIWGNTEKLMYIIMNEKGKVPREGDYSRQISYKFNKAIRTKSINVNCDEDLDLFINDIQEVQDARSSTINFLNINNIRNTIEFRVPNGTCKANVWLENIKLVGKIVEISEKLSKIEKKKTKSNEELALLALKDKLKEKLPEEEKLSILLDLLFDKECDKKIYKERYKTNSELIKNIPTEQLPYNENFFKTVDFSGKSDDPADDDIYKEKDWKPRYI